MEYIEKHFPDSEFSETSYIEGLLKDVEKYFNKTLNHISTNSEEMGVKELQIQNKVLHELEN
jgi:hypothetical protein